MSGLSGRNYEPKHNLARSARSLTSRSSEYSYEPSGPGPWLSSFEIARSLLGPLGSMPTLVATASCRLRRRSRALERRGFAASSYTADTRHYDLIYIYNHTYVA